MKYLRKNKGITLISLVVTIIVLLILVGVTFSALSGDNGILKKAAEAKSKTEKATDDEKKILENMEDYLGVADVNKRTVQGNYIFVNSLMQQYIMLDLEVVVWQNI